MPSKILRRSGIAVTQICNLYDWQPDVILQIGVGVHHEETDVFMESWPNVRLVGFEPDKRVREMLTSKYPGDLHPEAIWSEKATKTIHTKSTHGNGSSLFEHPKSDHGYEIDCIPLNTAIHRGYGGNTMLWLDCEGAEYQALLGGERAMKRIQFVNVEMTGLPPNPEWSKPQHVHEMLEAYGFTRIWIHTTRSIIGQYDAIYCRNELVKEDLRVW
jgi:FkbM family methyltransferase